MNHAFQRIKREILGQFWFTSWFPVGIVIAISWLIDNLSWMPVCVAGIMLFNICSALLRKS